MNDISQSTVDRCGASALRIALTQGQKICTVALDLVLAATQYQAMLRQHEDASHLVAEFGTRFGIDLDVSEALLAGHLKVELDGDQLVVQLAQPPAESNDQPKGFTTKPVNSSYAVTAPGPEERARRMQSVMSMHAASRGAPAHDIRTSAQLCEILCDLRHWCDAHSVDLYKGLDQSYMRYLHNRSRS